MRSVPGIKQEIIQLRDGRFVRFAQIEPHHAGAYCDYMLSLASESPWSGTVVEEVRSESDQRERFEETISSGCTWNLGVFENSTDEMIGDCSWTRSTHVKFAHVASLGIGIRDGWRGIGLGRIMMENAISAARADDRVEKLELGVFAKNEIARNLYRSLGFAEEGQRIRAVRQLDGSYDDDITMGLWVGS